MIINRANLSMLFTGYKASFQNAFAGITPDFMPFTLEVPSVNSVEQYGWLGNSTAFREWIGDRVIQNLALHDYSIKNKPFENTVGVPRENIEDDSFGLFNPLMGQLGQDSANHPSTLIYELLAGGFAGKCYDGQFFFDTDHPVTNKAGAEVSVSNFQGGSGTAWYLLDTSRVMKPVILQKRKNYNFVSMDKETDDNVFMRKEFIYGVDARLNAGYGLWQLAYASKEALDATSFNAAYAAMQNMTGDRGKKLGIKPALLVVPPTLRAKALEIINAEQINGTTNINRNAVDVLVTPWL
ncbi:Mu-like prophage major head subunit gpT family protein [Pseudomonas peli]|uniref:Mu-like prophage major head subunit gpT family protein n=1 Tax=Pseudomonas peli TaxID=592361 RepID=UPI00285474BE|nr:Mu-like prophage major head subunit gpT family protein [Pseudomonas peli]MDR7024387.1 phage major head subunit gpT-like protein [Pseudomonas peli]